MALNNGTLPEAELPSDFMTNVYLFRGAKEFTQLPSMKQKKFESTVKNFVDRLFKHSKYPVQFLSRSFDEINEFGTVLKQCNYLDNGSRVAYLGLLPDCVESTSKSQLSIQPTKDELGTRLCN
jgi:hypothetical protein